VPTDSKRKTAMENTVTILRGITAGSTYFRTLSLGEAATMRSIGRSEMMEMGTSFAWVHAGNEDIARHEVSPGTLMQGQFVILIDLIVADETTETLVQELEDLLHDVSLALGSNRTLSGAVVDSRISLIEPPTYSFEQMWAGTTVHLECIYDFNYGSEI